MGYPLDNCEKRTDDKFRIKFNTDHHTGKSPVLDFMPKVDMVKKFILDFMHLGCIGIMIKLICY